MGAGGTVRVSFSGPKRKIGGCLGDGRVAVHRRRGLTGQAFIFMGNVKKHSSLRATMLILACSCGKHFHSYAVLIWVSLPVLAENLPGFPCSWGREQDGPDMSRVRNAA